MNQPPPMDDIEELLGISEERLAQDRKLMEVMAFAGPAPFANRFYISGHGPVVRLSFGDQNGIDGDPQFRTAVSMTLIQAEELVDVLGRFIVSQKAAIENGGQ